MTPALFGSIAAAGLTVAFLHAALPTHWLPFVLAGRAQGWNRGKTLLVTGLAGAGHVLFTIFLGSIIAWLGITLDQWIGQYFPWIAAAVLMLMGVFYLLRGGHGHSHFGHAHGHRHVHDEDHARASDSSGGSDASARASAQATRRSDIAVIAGLVTVLSFSPCEGFLPVFATGVQFGWRGFFLLCAILFVATLSGMMLFTWLSLLGLGRFKMSWLEHNESRVIGVLLCLLAIFVLFVET